LPVDGPIPLHHYRRHRKTKAEERADQVAALAERIVENSQKAEAITPALERRAVE
jgi:hypothetical protein